MRYISNGAILMKRFLTAALLLCVAFSLGCAGNGGGDALATQAAQTPDAVQQTDAAPVQTSLPDDEQKEAFDYDFPDYSSFRGFDGLSTRIVETEDSIYIDYCGWLYFSDKEYKEFMPLCPRPDCRHDTEDCSSYIGSTSIQYGNGYIYYMEGTDLDPSTLNYPSLCRMKADGTAHERIFTLPEPEPRDQDFVPDCNRWDCFACNHYFFLRGVYSDFDDDGVPSFETHVYSIDLLTGNITELFEDQADPEVSGSGFMMLEGRGSKIYGQMLYSDHGGKNKIVEVDLESGHTKELCDFEPQLRTLERVSYIKDEALFFIDFDMPKDKQTLYRLDLNTCELVEVKQDSAKNSLWKDHDGYNGLFYRVGAKSRKPENRGLYICSENFELVDFAAYADYPEIYRQYYGDLLNVYNELYADTHEEPFLGITLSYITKDYIFGCGPGVSQETVEAYRENPDIQFVYNPTGCIPLWYLDKKDIGTGNLQWKKWAP